MNITYRTQLVDFMRSLKLPLTMAEIGVASGVFTSKLLQAGIEKLYLIDLWEHIPFIEGCASYEQSWHDKNFEQVINIANGYKDNVVILKGFSYKMAKEIPGESLGACYIDGDHTYNGTKTDLNYFYPKLVKGGIMCGHDYLNQQYGVQKAVTEFARGKTVNIMLEDGDVNDMGFWFIKE